MFNANNVPVMPETVICQLFYLCMEAKIGEVKSTAILVLFLFYLWHAPVSRVAIRN